MRKISALLGNSMRLDGGAMFGNVPKALWQKWLSPDELNRIPLTCRALLIEDEHKTILLETGIGVFFPPELQDRYGVVEKEHKLLDSLQQLGLTDKDIDVVILSHLHFDHAGGLLSAWEKDREQILLFPNARYLVSKTAWERACHPHFRDRASFIPKLNALLEKSNRLTLVESDSSSLLGKDYSFMYTHGHTPGMMHTILNIASPIIFAADLIPGTPWIHTPVTMGYDRAPENLIDEKVIMLDYAIEHGARIFYTHDHAISLSNIAKDEKGKYQATDPYATIIRMEV